MVKTVRMKAKSVIFILLPSLAVAQNGCYSNLAELQLDINEASAEISATYILCPNAVFEVGMAPLVPKSNSIIQCGEDGSSENNCVLEGGQLQITSSPTAGPGVIIVDAEIRGITFSNSTFAAAGLFHAGDITFRDCIFRVGGHGCSLSDRPCHI